MTINSEEFERLAPKHHLIGSPYSFCAHCLLGGVAVFIEKNRAIRIDEMAYFFETGHQSATEANEIMKRLFQQKSIKNDYRYAGHSFVQKEKTPAVQAADLLAWQWYTDKRHELEGRPRRKDCAILLEHHHNAVHIGPDKIVSMTEEMTAAINEGEPESEMLISLHYGAKTEKKKRVR